MLLRGTFLALALASTLAGGAYAQGAALVLRLPASARALALGDAFVLGSTDADAIFYNPAFPQELRGITGGVQWYGSGSVLMSAAGAAEWGDGAVAVGLRALDYAAPVSPATRAPRPAELLEGGAVPVAERAATLSYARRVRGVGLAASATLVEERIEAERGATVALGVAAGGRLGPVRAGLAVHNLGPALEVAGRELPLPDRVSLAASRAEPWLVGPLDVLPTTSLSRETDGTLVPAAGVEVAWWPVIGRTFYARAGVRNAHDGAGPLTLGVGFSGDRVSLDYAFKEFDDGTAHRVGLRWR